MTCLPAPLTYTSPTDNGFLSYIVPTETRIDLRHIMTNDPRLHYIHQPNLTGDRIIYPVMDSIFGQYRDLYGASAPLVDLNQTEAANIEVEQQAWQDIAPNAVSAYLQNGNVTIQSTDGISHNVPLTVSPGTTVNGAAFGTAYAGDLSDWLSVTVLQPQAIALPRPPRGRSARRARCRRPVERRVTRWYSPWTVDRGRGVQRVGYQRLDAQLHRGRHVRGRRQPGREYDVRGPRRRCSSRSP